MEESCCKLYTIRLDTTLFSPSKSQRKLLRRWEQYLAGSSSGTTLGGTRGSSAGGAPHVDSAAPAGMNPLPTRAQAGGKRAGQHAVSTPRPPAADDVDPSGLLAPTVQVWEQWRGAVAAQLAAARDACVAAQQLPAPPAAMPRPQVAATTPRLRRALGGSVHLSSAYALSVSRTAGSHAASANVAADAARALADAFNAAQCQHTQEGAGVPPVTGAAMGEPATPLPPYEAFATGGFVNFRYVGMEGVQAAGRRQSPVSEDVSMLTEEHNHLGAPAAATAALPGAAAAGGEASVSGARVAMHTVSGGGNDGGGAPPLPRPRQRQRQCSPEHNDAPPQRCQPPATPPSSTGHSFEMRMVRAAFDEESFQLYKRYQVRGVGGACRDAHFLPDTMPLVAKHQAASEPPALARAWATKG
eukprot:366278-Chlamydomonas_euryale.AAC.16